MKKQMYYLFELQGTDKLIQTKKTVYYSTKEVPFEDSFSLYSDQLPPVYVREVSSIDKIITEYPLLSISMNVLESFRKTGQPGFVLKKNDFLYFTPIKLIGGHKISHHILGKHLCADCKHLSSASDEDGGCEKVRLCSNRIERFPWITCGFEVFNNVRVASNSFIVVECEHYEKE